MSDKGENIEDVLSSVQKFLMKKEQECGSLRYLLSRATTETSNNIDQVVQGIVEIFNTYEICPTDEETEYIKMTDEMKSQPKICTFYRSLLLNTHFNIQQRLAEDALYGHFVESWPALSPYLFMQVIWNLYCEELLLETILHAPLELCLEIIDIIKTAIVDLEFKRGLHFVTQLIWYIYRRILMAKSVGTQSIDIMEYMEQLVAGFVMLLELLTNQKLTRMSDLPQEIRYQRQGIIIKCVIRLTKMCMEEKLTGVTTNALQKLYTLSLGDKHPYFKISSESLKTMINMVDKELVTLLVNMLKGVDCHMYIAWAEVDDQDNVLLTLQRAIAIECYYFIQYMQNDVQLQKNKELQKCLKQLAGPDEKEPNLTLQELCDAIQNGQAEGAMKELLKRYREWDETILLFVEKWAILLNTADCQVLFDYLKYTFSTKEHFEFQRRIYQESVMKILSKHTLPELYIITIKYMLRHFEHNFMEECYNSFSFHGLLNRSTGRWNNAYFFKHLLIHLLHSPKRVMTILMRLALGSDNYDRYVCLPQDMLMLQPFLQVKLDNGCTYLTQLMQNVCIGYNWNSGKFSSVVEKMLDAKVTTPDDIVNNVCIPYLMAKSLMEHNINCILINTYRIMDSYTRNIDIVALCTTLVRRMTVWRKCRMDVLRFVVNETLLNVIQLLSQCMNQNHMNQTEKRSVVNAVIVHIEPLDKASLSPLLHMTNGNIIDVITDYERRCYAMRKRFRLDRRNVSFMHQYVGEIRLGKKDFIRHMFLHATENEYQRYCLELTSVFWYHIGWKDEIDAFDNVLRIIMEAIRVTLEYTFDMPPDSFIFMIHNTRKFYNTFIQINKVKNLRETILRIFVKNLEILSESIKWTQYSEVYASFFESLQPIMEEKQLGNYHKEIVKLIDTFISNVGDLVHVPGDANDTSFAPNDDMLDICESYRFIRACLSVQGVEKHHRCTEKLEKAIFFDDMSRVDCIPMN